LNKKQRSKLDDFEELKLDSLYQEDFDKSKIKESNKSRKKKHGKRDSRKKKIIKASEDSGLKML